MNSKQENSKCKRTKYQFESEIRKGVIRLSTQSIIYKIRIENENEVLKIKIMFVNFAMRINLGY